MPPELVAALGAVAEGCWALLSEGRVALVSKGGEWVHGLWLAPLSIHFRPAPGKLFLSVAGAPIPLETHWDLSQPRQLQDAKRLTEQEFLDLYLFDEETRYLFTRRLPLPPQAREEAKRTLKEALGEEEL